MVIGDATLENYESAAFRWEDGVGMTRIGVPGEWWSRADKVTPDGRYVVGAYRNAAGIRTFLWNDESGGRDIGPQRQSSGRGSGACLTDDGATVYTTTGPNEEGNLSRWTEEAGMIDLGLPMSYVSDCTFDGEIVIGSDNGVGKLYEAGVGMFDLDDWLARYGVEVPARFSIFSPASIVKRGSNISIVGTAKEYDYNTYRYYSEAFVATVPEPLSVVPLAIGAGVLLLRRRRRLPEALQ